MVSRNADSPRISILLGLGRAGLAVLAGAAFAYVAWNPMPPPPADSAGAEVDEKDAPTLEAGRVEATYEKAAMHDNGRAFVAPDVWALATPRSGAFDYLSRDIAGVVNGDVAAGRGGRSSSTAEGASEATGMQRPRGPPWG